ncbi:uncharacterized protein NECHADRAFT_78923 [Fusarium vanettenii 77-13-4]|uniref:Uncharacterized protein n=1 Tax=Fusarium vanettenii (strain ATCC MYA-4622 / CBS 123669 / FGSC 9596 / NRRL 45880 / 77-13-4) TaxID=660122 RepID=C7YPZ1_FUSV7|nr:uncharacterized protein NECHADRAFT_78923 [Fusarium vanettenii 77-13-4]EEU45932.1 predicted protein [Fusarium vanettenii 77-13-4]
MCADDKQPSGKDKSVEDNLSGEEEEGYSTDEYSGVVEEAEMALVITPKKLTSVLSAGDAARYVRRNKNEARKKGNEKAKDAEEPTAVTPSKMAKNMERSIIAQRRKKKREQLSNPRGKANEESETMKKSAGGEKKASS